MLSLFKQYEGVFEEKEDPQKGIKKEREYSYSPFALQDAIGERNVKNIWIEYQKLILLGVIPNSLFYNVASKVRDMLYITKGAEAEDLDIKDYPYRKSKGHIKNWKKKDLEIFYEDLIDVLYKSRTSGFDLGAGLEKLLLSLN